MGHRYAVLGAGALGLTAALHLLERGDDVVVFEREPLPGGLAAGFELESGVWLEKFYHHLFRSDRTVAALIQQLGLDDRLVWKRPGTAVLHDGAAYQLDSPMSLLRFQPLGVPDRLRMGLALAYLRLLRSARPLEGRRAAKWLRTFMGRAAYETVWAPLLTAKFGALAEEVALSWFWGRVHDRSAELGYLRGGFQLLYERLAARIQELGGTIHLGTQVCGIASASPGLEVTVAPAAALGARSTTRFSRVVSTLPTRLTCLLTPELPAEYRAQYEWGQAYGAQCLILALDRPLTRTYWTNVNDQGYPFMVLVEHTNYMPPGDYGGRHLIYLGNYLPMDNPLFRASRAPVLEAFVPHLARINPLFTPRWIQESWLFTAPFAQPIVTVDYRHHIPPFETPVEGLYVANMFQVYPHDRGQNYSVALAERLVQALSTGVDSNVTAELEAAIPGRTPAGASGDPRR
jgi:protoporphyrinogen oxidase